MSHVERKDRIIILVAIVATIAAGLTHALGAPPLLSFALSAVSLATLAASIGLSIDQLATRISPSVTGILQSALGNLPELFICIFALRAGLIDVVQTALIGSILANSLLVLGLAFFAGGVVNGRQKFSAEEPRAISIVIAVAAAALVIPSLAVQLHTPAAPHAGTISVACAIVLLAIFVASVMFSSRIRPEPDETHEATSPRWPIGLTFGVLVAASIASAFVSDWFVEALSPTIALLGISQAFTGLVVVAVAGNAVENVVGVTMAIRNKTALSISLILNSSLQVSVALIPALVLLCLFIPGANLTLVFPPLLVIVIVLAAVVPMMAISDGESNWLEGVALIGLYAIVAAAFWWG